MSLKSRVTTVLAVGALLGTGAASATIINGGFEDPDIRTGSYGIFDSITGWTASRGAIEIQDNIAGTPFEGDQFLELDSTRPSTIFQDVGGLITGEQYLLSFAFTARGGTDIALDNVLSVLWDGIEVFNNPALTTNPIWSTHSVLVSASASSNRLVLADVSANHRNSFGVYLDDIQLTRIPEPGTLALLGLALLGVGAARRRRKV